MVSSDDWDLFDSDDGSITDLDRDMSEGEYCVVLDDGSVAEDEDFVDSDVLSVTYLDSYRSDVDKEDNCDGVRG